MAIRINYCPDCHSLMHRAGWSWSGRKQIQRYRCPKCGRTTIHTTSAAYPKRRVTKHQIDGVRLVKVRSA